LLKGIEAARWKPFFSTRNWFYQSPESLKWTTLKQPLVEGSKRGNRAVYDRLLTGTQMDLQEPAVREELFPLSFRLPR
jgi:hypothetical protein